MSLPLIIILVLGFLVVAVLGFVATRPDSFRLERSTVVGAPAATIFPLIEDFHRWILGSPFEKIGEVA